MNETPTLHCPLASDDDERITIAHGEGGRLMRKLISERILPPLDNQRLASLSDAAVLPRLSASPVLTTDSFVVSPLFFPGGDIGSLSVYGTVNDLAVSGARPLWISLALILEEGFPFAWLDRVLASVADAARATGVDIVTGDTKVVPRGAADGLFINTAGLGELMMPMEGPKSIRPGDALLVSGPLGRHGIAVLAAREGLDFDPQPESDSASLYPAVEALCCEDIPVKAIRDATRSGAAAVLHEWAEASDLTLCLESGRVPVTPQVRGACELLGLDPLHIACEGTLLVVVAPEHAERALEVLRRVEVSSGAAQVGNVLDRQPAPVVVQRALGQQIPLDEPPGAPLPRIC